MINADQILKLVNDYLVQLPYDRRPASLYEPIRYVLSMGGKRIRPVLMLLSYNLFKEDPETILMPACALETYHNYTLLHDDLCTRSGMPILQSSQATQCSCLLISVCSNAAVTRWLRCWLCSPRQLSK